MTWDGVASYRQPDVAIARGTGDLSVARAQRSDDAASPSTVYVMTCADGGETWTDPVDVTAEDGGRDVNQYLPGIDQVAPTAGTLDAVASSGWLHGLRGSAVGLLAAGLVLVVAIRRTGRSSRPAAEG